MPRRLPTKTAKIPVAVVAGGAGFLGSHICESLLNSGIKVLALDDLVTGSSANLASVKKHPNFEFIECNINQGIPDAVKDTAIDYIIHAAGVETHGESQEATLAMALTGAFGTKNLLDLAVQSGARMLLISSINIYEGLASSSNLAYYFGSDATQEARFSQQEAKRYAEGLCELYVKEYNLDVRVARLSQLYGPRMDLRSPELMARLIRAAVDGNDIKIDADSSETMYLTYVTDAVYGISRLLFAEGKAFKGAIFSFANPEKVSVISVAYTLRDFLPSGGEVTFGTAVTKAEFMMPKLPLDTVKRELDWEPAVMITEGLKLTMEAFKSAAPPTDAHQVEEVHLRTGPAEAKTETTMLRAEPAAEANIGGDKKVTPGLRFRGAEGAVKASDMVVRDNQTPGSSVNQPKPVPPPSGPPVKSKKVGTKKLPSWWRRLLFAGIAIVLYGVIGRPVVHTAAYAASGALHLRAGASQGEQLKFGAAEGSFAAAEDNFRSGANAVGQLGWLGYVTGQSRQVGQLEQGLTAAAEASSGLATLTQAAPPLFDELQHLVRFDAPQQGDADIARTIADARQTVGLARQQLQRSQVALSNPVSARVAGVSTNGGQTVVPQSWLGTWLNKGSELVSRLLDGLAQIDAGLAVMPEVLGDQEAKEYLIMLQNSNELRPTGGFLGSFAILQLRNGRVSGFKIDDIYNPAGQVKSTTPAPEALVKAFGGKMLSIQDANWSPDTAVSARQVADLYEQATGESVDGMVFVTTQAIKDVMGAVGPLQVDGYKEIVTAENFTQLAQVYADVGFEPGSTGKADFLGAMANQLINRLQKGGDSLLLPVGKAALQGLISKEVTMWSRDEPVQATIREQHWAGGFTSTSDDYLRVVDANVAANKSNYYVSRSTEYAINVDRASALHGVVTVTWKHAGTSATWPGGDYKNYVRVYVPEGSVLNSTTGFNDDEVSVTNESGKTVFGGFITVPYNSQKSITVRYSLPLSMSLPEQDYSYRLTWQKQPGVVGEPLKVIFNAPIFLETTSYTKGGRVTDSGSIEWSGPQPNDTGVRLQLQPKHPN